MKNDFITLNKKTLTKLLNQEFRAKILCKLSKTLDEKLKLTEYAKYIVDNQIISRSKFLENDKASYYGFQPINIICAIKENRNIEKRFIEFNTINHFLKSYQGEIAIDVVKCILFLWFEEDNAICSFDYQLIDSELQKIEKQYNELNDKEEMQGN